MAGPAFISREDCSIQSIAELDIDLISDCSVPEAPEPIWAAMDFPIPVPPELAIGCPEIGLSTSVTYGSTPGGDFTVVARYTNGD